MDGSAHLLRHSVAVGEPRRRWNQAPRRFVGTPTPCAAATGTGTFSVQHALPRGDAVNKVRALDTRHKVTPALDTPTDLSSQAVTEISKKLNVVLADVFALYLKTKNFHWH